ncbi:GNAT family N-acetyltransferase [Billgrantia aerodenitrificans]|uniref:GNAT family N-acetyltransferase n=1 Tax=Billgrantia aerodenitrificans TaxID=2733483 RepID=A0ABS9AMC7_9GAMM|nr:GNAT family protein [Halomonas aerodenitrificans]MCE8022877.1 GNAT family N-acetyltransferase [Halomonas aerodenitrificans]
MMSETPGNQGHTMLPSRIETERLVLRKPRPTDGPLLYQTYTSDAEVTRYLIWRPHQALAETQQFVDACIKGWQARTHFPYVLTLQREEHEPIGMLDARPRGHIVEVGYVLARRYWQRGLMPEALTTLTELCLALPETYRVQATCDVDNLASARLLEKCGFQQEGRLERYVVHPNLGAEPRDCFMYARCR